MIMLSGKCTMSKQQSFWMPNTWLSGLQPELNEDMIGECHGNSCCPSVQVISFVQLHAD